MLFQSYSTFLQEDLELNSKLAKRFRQIAHHLDPVVTVGDQGLTDNLSTEVNRALTDHELIKVRISVDSREDRAKLAEALANQCNASIVQKIGKIIVLYRENPKPNAKLSNVQRFGP